MRLYNTPKKTVEDIQPQNAPEITVYTCGPTVYDYPHIGNWFTFIRYDILVRALKAAGFKPQWVMNITDVGHLVSDADEGEDKLEKGAKREGKTAWDIAEFYTMDFKNGLKALNFVEPDVLPRATEHIPEQIELVKQLEEKGFTYVIDDGVYFDTSKFDRYAEFAGLNLSQQDAGARVEVNPQKRNPTDFALWKFSPKDQKRDMEWDSPWGKGFPGWHLECSTMAMKYLGETIDIHAGGIDHIPIHHTNEVAQSEAATGKLFSRYWMHANHILVDGQKIAKSLGNGITLQDIEAKGFSPMDVRMLALESHYRSQAQFSWDSLQAAHNRLNTLRSIADLRFQSIEGQASETYIKAITEKIPTGILDALTNDLNTSQVLALLSEYEPVLLDEYRHDAKKILIDLLQQLNDLLGLDLLDSKDISDEQKQTIAARQRARDTKDWVTSDKLRDELAEQGIGIRDTDHGQVWHRL